MKFEVRSVGELSKWQAASKVRIKLLKACCKCANVNQKGVTWPFVGLGFEVQN